MMNFEEMRQIVAFMKENGVSELEYTDRHTSVKLKLGNEGVLNRLTRRTAGEAAEGKAEEAVAVDEATPEQGIEIDLNAVVGEVARKAADGVGNVASYVKSRLEDLGDSIDPVEIEIDIEPMVKEEAPTEESVETEAESTTEEDSELRDALKQAGESVLNTVKAGAYLGRAGLRRGQERLGSLFRPDVIDEEPEDFVLPEDDKKNL